MVYARLLKPKVKEPVRKSAISCDGKKQFSSYGAAERSYKNLRRHHGVNDRLHIYLCNHCGRFHLGSGTPEN